jgi:hypothetical protein
MTTTSDFDPAFESGDYEKARDIAIAQLASKHPTREALAAFKLADDQHRLNLLRQLVTRFPESLDAKLALIHELIHQRRGDVAIRECGNALSTMCESKEQFLLRRARLTSALQSGKADYLIEDVKFIAESDVSGAERLFNAVIAEFVGVHRPELRFSLELLAGQNWIDEGFRNVLISKQMQLEYLESRKT